MKFFIGVCLLITISSFAFAIIEWKWELTVVGVCFLLLTVFAAGIEMEANERQRQAEERARQREMRRRQQDNPDTQEGPE